MYNYFEDKQLLRKIQSNCSGIVKEVEEELRNQGLNSQVFLIGSGGRNMVMQNENEPIDFDYNLNVLSCDDINNCKEIKELVRKTFNKVMRRNNLDDVDDSTSSLTTKKYHLVSNPEIEFSIDLAVVTMDNSGEWYRLKHEKTGYSYNDRYYWNEVPNSKGYNDKAIKIKQVQCWELVREQYKNIKNKYLTSNDHDHPSFICYIEAVNNVYNHLRQKNIIKK